MIIDASYTGSWMEPSSKFMTVACYSGPSLGGGKKGPVLTRILTGIDAVDLASTHDFGGPPPQGTMRTTGVASRTTTTLGTNSTDSVGLHTNDSTWSVARPDKKTGQFWANYNMCNRDSLFSESNLLLKPPPGSLVRAAENYEDSIVRGCPTRKINEAGPGFCPARKILPSRRFRP